MSIDEGGRKRVVEIEKWFHFTTNVAGTPKCLLHVDPYVCRHVCPVRGKARKPTGRSHARQDATPPSAHMVDNCDRRSYATLLDIATKL